MTRQCAGCSSVIERGEQFCRRCGLDLTDSDWSSDKSQPDTRKAQKNATEPELNWQAFHDQTFLDFEENNLESQSRSPRREKSRTRLELGILIAVVVTSLVIAWKVYSPHEPISQFSSPMPPEEFRPESGQEINPLAGVQEEIKLPQAGQKMVEGAMQQAGGIPDAQRALAPELGLPALKGDEKQSRLEEPGVLEESKDYETDIYRRIKARDASKPKKVEDQPEEQRRKTDGPAEPARATKSAPVEPPTTPAAVTHGGVRFASAEEIRRRRQEIERKRVEREMREMKEPIISGVRIASSEEIERKREQIERTRTQQAIKEAIASRGIEGVEAVFIKGTVFLAGEVQTKSQKTAAEQAARQFPQVRDVRNSISVKWIQSQMTR